MTRLVDHEVRRVTPPDQVRAPDPVKGPYGDDVQVSHVNEAEGVRELPEDGRRDRSRVVAGQ